MLYDQRRTGDYLRAIAAGVKPGDVVVEIGTGSGVLAIAAARAGARRVYAIEASDIGPVAQRSFERNGVADVVTLVRGWSRHVTLPELADVLVSEVIGNEPLEEEILETTLDARQRLLRPDGLLLPNALHLHARPLRLPDADHQQRAIGQRSVRDWRHRYAMDFSALLDAADPGPVNMPTEGEVASTWPVVGPTMRLASVDLTSFDQATVTGWADLSIAVGNQVNAVAVTFRADLLDDVGHELDPWRWPMSSWATSVWVLPDTIEMAGSARLRVTYRRRVTGQLDGLDAEVVTAD
jgi:precorrin-6B methylase 2